MAGRTLVLMGDSRPLTDRIVALTVPRNAWYARKHGYDFRFAHYSEPLRTDGGGTAHPSWAKVAAALAALREGYDTVVWMDTDAFVRAQAVALPTFLASLARRPAGAAVEFALNMPFGSGACAGFFVVHQCPAAHALLAAWLRARHTSPHRSKHCWEQSVVEEWLSYRRPYSHGNLAKDIAIMQTPSFVHAPAELRHDNFVVHVSNHAGAQRIPLIESLGRGLQVVDDAAATPFDPNIAEA